MEMIPASSIGPLQFLPHAKHEDPLNPEYSAPPILALGLKTFAHLTEADTLFTSSSLWSLFLPKDPLSSVYRGLLSQPLLWRLGLHTAFTRSSSYSKTIETAAEDVLHQDEVDVDLLHAILKTNLSACNTLPDCFQLLYSQHQKSEMSNIFKFYSWHSQYWVFLGTMFWQIRGVNMYWPPNFVKYCVKICIFFSILIFIQHEKLKKNQYCSFLSEVKSSPSGSLALWPCKHWLRIS